MEELRITDYLSILKRRQKIFLLVAASVFLCSLLFALSWSNYRSVATVEIAQSEIPDSMATPTGMNLGSMLESLADLRISRLQQKVLATGSLVEIITKFNLYPNQRQATPIADIAEKMRAKVKIDLVSSALANPASAQKVTASQLSAIAFNLSYDYSDALLAQQVTNELVSRFLDEDLKDRRNQAKETAAFLDSQIKIVEESLKDQEKQIAEFRSQNGEVRPEALAFNQQAAAQTIMSIQNIESQMTSNLGSQGALRAQLASTDPYSQIVADGRLLTTPSAQLKTLKSTYASLTAKYGPDHPDVRKAKRQIESMESELGGDGDTSALQATILDTRGRLETALKTYGPKNPEVVSLRNQLKNLEKQLEATGASESTTQIKKDADNPAYLQIVAQLRTAEEQYKALAAQKASLQAQQAKYQAAIVQNPAAEQKLAELTRGYDNAQLRYRDLKAKKMAADMSATIEQDRSGQRLVVINPPELPNRTQPARKMFVLIGFVLSVMLGLATIIGIQFIKQCVVGARHLESLVGVAPLAVIPHLTTKLEKEDIQVKRLKLIAAGIVGFILLLIVFSYVVMPLDVFWSILMRRIGLS